MITPTIVPLKSAIGIAAQLNEGLRETNSDRTAVMPRTEPTARSMPPVRITNVIPAARTMLIEACRTTLIRLFVVRKLSVRKAKRTQMTMRTGSIPAT